MSEAPSALGRRIVITGLAGSGKSTFAVALAARTGLPVIHLDLSYWNPGWVAPSEIEWREKQRDVLAGDAWIAEGNYHETLDLRLARARTPSWCSTRPGVSVRLERSDAGSRCRTRCPTGAPTRPGCGFAMSGAWQSGSGASAARNRSENRRRSRDKGSN